MQRNFSNRMCLFSFIVCLSLNLNAQKRTPKNYIGISGVAELTRLSIGCGVEYERWLYTADQWAIGTKINHIFSSKTLNILFASNDLLQKNNQTQIMSNAYYFINKKEKTEGFFFSFGLGANFVKWSKKASDPSNPDYYYTTAKTVFSPGVDFSVGGQSVFKNKTAIRLTVGCQTFASSQNDEFFSGNNLVQFYTKISFGF